MPRAFTLIELLAVLASLSLLSALIASQPDRKSMEAKDIQNLRGIGQGLVLWGNSHGDSYPLPSEIDKNDATVPGGKTANRKSVV